MKSNYSRAAGSGVAASAPLHDVRPSLEMTFRGHRQSVLGVDMQPISNDVMSSYQSSGAGASQPLPPKTVSCGADGSVLLWDAKPTTRALRFVGHRGPVMGCAFSPKALLVASCGHDGYVRLWVPDLRRTTSSFPGTRLLTQGTAPSASSSSVVPDADGSVSFKAHSNGAARALAFAKDGSDVLYTVGEDKGVKAWDLNYVSAAPSPATASSSRFLGSFLGGHTNWVRCVAVQASAYAASQTAYLATGGDDAAVILWDTRSRQVAHRFSEHDGGVRSIAFHPGGYLVASGDSNGVINVFDVRRASSSSSTAAGWPGQARYGLVQHYVNAHGSTGSAVNGLDFCPKGHWLLSAGDDAVVKLWDTLEGYLYCAMEAHAGPVRACRFSCDGNFFTTGGSDKVVMVWRSGLPGRCTPIATTYAAANNNNNNSNVSDVGTRSGASRTPLMSTAMEDARARLAKAHYHADAAAPDAASSSPYLHPPPSLSARPQTENEARDEDGEDVHGNRAVESFHDDDGAVGLPRDRSFERDEARCSHIGDSRPPQETSPANAQQQQQQPVDVAPANAPAESTASASSSVKRVRFSESANDAEPQEQQEQQEQQQQQQQQQQERIENLERAVARLGEQVRTELLLQRRETQALRDEWEQSQVQHRDEMQKLMMMMAQLVQQQTILVAQQQEYQKNAGNSGQP